MLVPRGRAEALFALAREAGIEHASLHEVRVLGGQGPAEELKIKSSAPRVKAFLAAYLRSPLNDGSIRFSAHDVLALVDGESAREVTVPACVPFSDVQHDLWRYCHVTASFLARTVVSAALLAYAMINDDPLLIVGALIFTPFSPLVLSAAFGLAASRPELARHALRSLSLALLLTVASAAATARLAGGPVLFDRYGNLPVNFAFSIAIGVMAALADCDEVGRRQLLGLAMAYPFVKYAAWLGLALSLGFPEGGETLRRLAAFGGNAVLMTAAAALTYRLLGRRGELTHLPR